MLFKTDFFFLQVLFITYIYFIFPSRLKNMHYIFHVRRDHNPKKSFYTFHILFYCASLSCPSYPCHPPSPPQQMIFLFCFWMRKKSRKEVYSPVPASANFGSTSVAHSAHCSQHIRTVSGWQY